MINFTVNEKEYLIHMLKLKIAEVEFFKGLPNNTGSEMLNLNTQYVMLNRMLKEMEFCYERNDKNIGLVN